MQATKYGGLSSSSVYVPFAFVGKMVVGAVLAGKSVISCSNDADSFCYLTASLADLQRKVDAMYLANVTCDPKAMMIHSDQKASFSMEPAAMATNKWWPSPFFVYGHLEATPADFHVYNAVKAAGSTKLMVSYRGVCVVVIVQSLISYLFVRSWTLRALTHVMV